MGILILDMVVDLLKEGGVRAEAAQPAGDMTTVQSVVAAVSLESVDQADGSVTVLVEMMGPVTEGAKRCQKRALDAFNILRSAGAVCRQGKCTFISKADMFCTPVKAVFYGTAYSEDWQPRPDYEVTAAGVLLPQTCGFSAKQQAAEEGVALADAGWEFSLEEFFPAGTQEPEDPAEPFVLTVFGDTYTGCIFTARERVAEEDGIRQIRRGTAEGRTADK